METFLLDGKWEAEDDPSPGSADKITPTSKKYDGRYTYLTSQVLSFVTGKERPQYVVCQKTFTESVKPRKLTRRTETCADLANKFAGFFSRITTYEIRDE